MHATYNDSAKLTHKLLNAVKLFTSITYHNRMHHATQI